jgi:hypothetical protein
MRTYSIGTICFGNARRNEKSPAVGQGFGRMGIYNSHLRATTAVREGNAIRTVAGETLNRHAPIGDANHLWAAETFIAGGRASFFGAAATTVAAIIIPTVVTVADDGTDTVRSHPQFQVLGGCGNDRSAEAAGHQGNGKPGLGDGLEHMFLLDADPEASATFD